MEEKGFQGDAVAAAVVQRPEPAQTLHRQEWSLIPTTGWSNHHSPSLCR